MANRAAAAVPDPNLASAGKIQLLDLAALKERLGPKWQRMSGHVQQFFEAAIRRSLGPGDAFIHSGELAYLVTFRDCSTIEAEFRCRAISEEVCRRLFGEQVTMRNLVAAVPLDAIRNGENVALDQILERDGTEIIVQGRSAEAEPEVTFRVLVGRRRRLISARDIGFVYRPMWDLLNRVVLTYLCQPRMHNDRLPDIAFWTAEEEEARAALDVHILRECIERVRQLRIEGLRIVLAVPVHFMTVARSRSWNTYQDILKHTEHDIWRDLAFVLHGIDAGIPHVRLAHELPKLSRMAYRVFCIADRTSGAGGRFANTGAHGIGTVLADDMDETDGFLQLNGIAKEARLSAMDGFALGVRSTSLALLCVHTGVRYVEGAAVRPAVENPRHGFAQNIEDLYRAKRSAS